jgi:hypothetical protein
MSSVTLMAPLVVHCSSISVGALHRIGDGGVTRKSVMWTVDAGPPLGAPEGDVVGGAAGEVVDVRTDLVVGLVDTGTVDRVDRVELVGLVDLAPTVVGVLVVVEDDE